MLTKPSLNIEIKHFSCFIHNPVVDIWKVGLQNISFPPILELTLRLEVELTGDVAEDSVGVLTGALPPTHHPQKFKNFWSNLG